MRKSDYIDYTVDKISSGGFGPGPSVNPDSACQPQDSEAGSATRAGADDLVVMGAVNPAAAAPPLSEAPVATSPLTPLVARAGVDDSVVIGTVYPSAPASVHSDVSVATSPQPPASAPYNDSIDITLFTRRKHTRRSQGGRRRFRRDVWATT